MTSDVTAEHRLSAWNPNDEEVAAILIEMRPIVRAFAERDAPAQPAASIAGSGLGFPSLTSR